MLGVRFTRVSACLKGSFSLRSWLSHDQNGKEGARCKGARRHIEGQNGHNGRETGGWYGFLVVEEVRPGSPAEHVRRPRVGDEGETPGLTRDELRRLLAAAEEHGSLRSVALMSVLAHTGVRIGEALSRDVEHLGHDRGHRILRLERKGGQSGRAVLTAPVVRALDAYLDGRETGAIFITKTGRRMDQPEAWRMVRRLARRAITRRRR